VEVIRTDEYVEIRCPERDAHIRLFDDRMEALNSKTGNWENVAHGRWVFELTAHGRPLDVGKHAVTRLVDWNRDGKLDLLVGAGDGYVWIFRNVGSPTEFRLAPGEHVKDGRDDLRAGDGFTTACFVDLTGDGKADLLVAHSEDQIRLYVNRGTAALPAFNGYTGIPGLNGADLQLEKDCGARIDVGVWDGDGLPDM
jgi:hypothetical protein